MLPLAGKDGGNWAELPWSRRRGGRGGRGHKFLRLKYNGSDENKMRPKLLAV